MSECKQPCVKKLKLFKEKKDTIFNFLAIFVDLHISQPDEGSAECFVYIERRPTFQFVLTDTKINSFIVCDNL